MDVKQFIFGGGVLKKILLLILLLLIAVVGYGSVAATPAVAAATITYNLYATDGFITLADGTVLYNYGFVGGRANAPFTFQYSSVKPPTFPAGVVFTPNGVAPTIAGGAPTPTGGPTT